jgi:hypothetical protein
MTWDLSVDDFMTLVLPQLEEQIDEFIAAQPITERPALLRQRQLLLGGAVHRHQDPQPRIPAGRGRSQVATAAGRGMTTPGPRLDPIFYPGDGTVVLRIRSDDGTETTIELHWEKVLDVGATLSEHGLAAKRHAEPEPEQGADAPRRG